MGLFQDDVSFAMQQMAFPFGLDFTAMLWLKGRREKKEKKKKS